MKKCEVCGNEYDKTFDVKLGGHIHTFDCFECVIQALAPICLHCGCRIIGHVVEAGGRIYCCVNCAGKDGVLGVKDRTANRTVSGSVIIDAVQTN